MYISSKLTAVTVKSKTFECVFYCKVENILKHRLDLISSSSPSVKIQIIVGKVSLRFKGKTLLSVVNKLLVFISLLTRPSNFLV